MIIEDGKGSGKSASVSSVQRLNVSAKINPRIFYISRDDGQAYSASMSGFSADAGEFVFYLKNTSSTRNMFISQITVSALQAVLWKLWSVTGTAAAGTSITPTNLNLSSGLIAESISMGGGAAITGLTEDGILIPFRSTATASMNGSFVDALILGPGKAIAVEYDTGTTGICDVNVMFHYENLQAG